MKKKWMRLTSIMCSIALVCTSAFAVSGSDYTTKTADTDSIIYISEDARNEDISIPVGNAQYIDDGSGTLIPIAELPSFDTQEEADKYIDSLVSSVTIESENIDKSHNVMAASTSADKIVASKNISAAILRLRVQYTKNSKGQVTSRKPYTTFTGVTLGLSWHQKSCTSQLSGDKKKISASATGEVAMYLIVDGVLEFARRTHHISGKIVA